jgi:hypothetical protein
MNRDKSAAVVIATFVAVISIVIPAEVNVLTLVPLEAHNATTRVYLLTTFGVSPCATFFNVAFGSAPTARSFR